MRPLRSRVFGTTAAHFTTLHTHRIGAANRIDNFSAHCWGLSAFHQSVTAGESVSGAGIGSGVSPSGDLG